MKKLILLGLCLLVFAGSAFSLDWAIGGGGMFSASWSNAEDWTDPDFTYTLSRQGFGGFVFFGLGRYLEANLGFLYKSPKTVDFKYNGTTYISFDVSDPIYDFRSVFGIQFGLYFKYPFVLSDRIVLFPTAGVDYELTVGDEKKDWWDDVWFRGGVGLDIFFSQRAFLRVHALYGVGVFIGDEDYSFFGYYLDAYKTWSHGMLFKVGVGFMF